MPSVSIDSCAGVSDITPSFACGQTALQALGVEHQPLAVLEQDLQQITSFAAKDERMAAEWILPMVLLHQGGKPVEAATHIRQPSRQPDPDAGPGVIIRAERQRAAERSG
jgi:hypothetical protein